MKLFNRITIIGLGLIGGSLALAIKEKKLAKEIAGVSRRKSTIDFAIKNKIVDLATLDLKDGVKDSDLIVIATPVLKIFGIAKQVVPFLKKDAIFTDAGSTKGHIVKAIEGIGFQGVDFVGSHPIAGSEKSGIKSANKDLFKKSFCVLTKTKYTNPKAIERLKKFWGLLGMQVAVMSPEMHDRLLSEISHLPHAVSVSLVNSIGKEARKFAGSGFKDVTRIASGEPELWKDVFLTNRHNLMRDIEVIKGELSKMQIALRKNDEISLLKFLKRAKAIRDSL